MKALSEQTILVTGSTDGLGRRLAAELARLGVSVIVHGRDPGKVRAAAAETGASRGLVADLASLDDVHELAGQIEQLDTLVNNAGVIEPERRVSADGHELTFAVNHLAHFALTGLLLPKLADGGRIVNVSSIGQAPLDFADIEFERGYDAYTAYARSKLAQVLFTFELADRLGRRDPTVNALHPATLMDTKMVRESFGQSRSSVEEGVEAVLRLVTEAGLDGVTGPLLRRHPGERSSTAGLRPGRPPAAVGAERGAHGREDPGVTRWLVDGMNVIGSRPTGWWRDRPKAMRALAGELGELARSSGAEVTVVFDGRPFELEPADGVTITFARRRGRDAADDDIVELVACDDDPGSLTVVTSDRALTERVAGAGANVVGAGEFRSLLGS